MDGIIFLFAIVLVLISFGLIGQFLLKRIVIFEHERGVVYRRGKFHRTLQPGSHWLYPYWEKLQKVDIRERFSTIPGQELLTSDKISVKVSVAVNFNVDEPFKALNKTFNYTEALYSILQVELRDLFGSRPIDELLMKRRQIGENLLEKSKDKATELGLALLSADIKDIMLPGDIKNIFAQIVNARNEGLAALERARGESASLRNLANTAKLLENNPALLQLRILQALENKSGNTIVLSTSPESMNVMPVSNKK
jgi:regulator of protease activity HflC (stomatin/prohibitin superfamily)